MPPTISHVLPTMNKETTNPKHFTLGILGENFASGAVVTVKQKVGTTAWNWEVETGGIIITSTQVLVKLQRKAGEPEGGVTEAADVIDPKQGEAKGTGRPKDLGQITVTVTNPTSGPNPGTATKENVSVAVVTE